MAIGLLLGSVTAVRAEAELSSQNAPQPVATTGVSTGDAGAEPCTDASPCPITGTGANSAAQTTPPPLPATEPGQPSPVLNQMLDKMQGLNVEPLNAIPPEFEDENGDETEEQPVPRQEGPSVKIPYVDRPEESQLIVELALDDQITIFDSALTIYTTDDTALVPLGRFAEDVGFPIKVDTATGTAEGWFLKPENTFKLHYPYEFVEIAGKKIPVRQLGIAETHIDDIYVSLDLLNSWFPIGLTLSYNELRLYMKTLIDLPVQERAKRHGRWEASTFNQKQQPGSDYNPKDVIKLPHRWYAAPSLGITHSFGYATSPGSKTATTGTSLEAATDLFGMNARLSAGFSGSSNNREEIQGLRFHLSKEDYDATLLGPLKATKYELGDISTISFPLAAEGTGRGFSLTNQPYNFISDAANFRLSGFGPAGWDVEVFQGGEIIAFSTVTSDGRYDFETLPLKGGFNLFKIILYGPHGEQEERYERYYLGQDMVPQGKFLYNASAVQSLTPLLDVSTSPPEETPPMVSLMTEYGVSKNLSASAGLFHGEGPDEFMLDGAGFGLRASGKSTYAQLNGFIDKTGGKSLSGLLTGNLTETANFNVEHTRHGDFAPGVYSTERSTSVSISELFDFKKEILPDINLTVGVSHDKQESGKTTMTYSARASANFLGMSISNSLDRTTHSDGTQDSYNGGLTLRKRTPWGLLHSDWDYIFHPGLEVQSGKISLQTSLTEKLSLTNTLRHTFGISPTTAFNSSLGWKFDKFNLSVNGEMDNKRNRQILATVAYNLMPRTLYGDYTFAEISDSISNGRLIIRPYVDYNANGKYDKGEPLVKDVTFLNMLRAAKSMASSDGTVILPGLTPSLVNRIIVDEKSITDIYLTPVKKELLVQGKSGVNGPIDFAFSKLGSINGTLVAIGPSGNEAPLNEARMVLLNKEGKEVAEAYSESDGYFNFDSIPVGSYELFFPVSETLRAYYSGSGEGPNLQITLENPELQDIKIKVEQTRISVEGLPEPAPPAAEPAPEELKAEEAAAAPEGAPEASPAAPVELPPPTAEEILAPILLK